MPSNPQAPVLIVGGGIVGLSASLCLSHFGIHSILVERHASTSIHPRARSVNARSMELFRRLGLEDLVREAGATMAATMGIYTGASMRAVIEPKARKEGARKLPLAGITDSIGPVKGLFITQDMIEPILFDIARQRGGDVQFHTECLNVSQDADGVTATLQHRENGTTSTVRASYLIAADGAGSPIRTRLNVPTSGRGTMGHLLNILFHADLSSLVKGREFSLIRIDTPEVRGLFTSINNSDRWVFHLYYDPGKGEKPADYPPERCKELLRLATGFPDLEIDIKSILPWEPSVRIAEKLQYGRIFLAGDAAHQMPPWAGQGANSGIADAANLAWKLAMVLHSVAPPALLETYGTERIPVGRAAAEASAAAADERGIINTKKLSLILGLVGRIRIMSGHGYAYSSRGICAEDPGPLRGWSWRPWTLPSLGLAMDGRPGSRVPHLWGEWKGTRRSTLDLCGSGFVLLAGAEGREWIEAAKRVSSSLGIDIQAHAVGGAEGGSFVIVPKGAFEAAAGIAARGAILVRPDDFIAWRSRRQTLDPKVDLEKGMREALCLDVM